MRKLTQEEAYQIFKSNCCKLLGEYKGSKIPVEYICECGLISKISLKSLQSGSKCIKCANKKKTFTQEQVIKIFKDGDCKLIGKYKNSKLLIEYICRCGNISKISLNHFQQGKRCKSCRRKRQSISQTFTQEQIAKIFEDGGCKLIGKYKSAHILVDYICECKNKSKIRLSCFQRGHRCKSCAIKKISGKNSPLYNSNLTDEEREIGRNYPEHKEWTQIVYRQDDYTCQKCGERSGNLNAHHMYAYSKYPSIRTNPDNGITFCKDCHKNFHHIYGHNNDFDQLTEFLNYKEV